MQVVVKIDEHVGVIHDAVHHGGHDESSGHVKDGVLFDEHCRQNDRHAQNQGTDPDTLVLFQTRALHHCEMAAERIIYMDAGPEVCRSVRLVKHGNQSCAQVISGHGNGTKIVSVWPEGADNQKNRHSGKQESTDPEIIVFTMKEKIEDCHRHVNKPQQIGDDENLAEGDEVIGPQVDQVIMACHGFLQPGKPLHIYDPVEKERQCVFVSVTGFCKCLCHKIGSLSWSVNILKNSAAARADGSFNNISVKIKCLLPLRLIFC